MSLSISIQLVTYDDVPVLARINGDSSEPDRHTQMKGFRKKPFNMFEVASYLLPKYFSKENFVIIMAVDDTTCEVVGFCCWGIRGFEKSELPREDPGKKEEPATEKVTPENEESKGGQGDEQEKEIKSEIQDQDGVKRLEAMTDADMKHWMETLMPPGTKCMYIGMLFVAPAFQFRGVGRALLKWGTETADKANVFIWVHSSESAWKVYEKHGFKIVGTLNIDLDEWAPAPPPDEEEGAVWGHYVFRYMKRLPTQDDLRAV